LVDIVHISPIETLSPRELQVLRLIARGKEIAEIGADLTVAETTIDSYVIRISEKLGGNRCAAVAQLAQYDALHAGSQPLDLSIFTRVEVRVFALLSECLSNAEIGSRMGRSESTIKSHIVSIFAKLGVNARTAATYLWHRQGPNSLLPLRSKIEETWPSLDARTREVLVLFGLGWPAISVAEEINQDALAVIDSYKRGLTALGMTLDHDYLLPFIVWERNADLFGRMVHESLDLPSISREYAALPDNRAHTLRLMTAGTPEHGIYAWSLARSAPGLDETLTAFMARTHLHVKHQVAVAVITLDPAMTQFLRYP
jgi:DNA-binding NarL/FixJ family response regulator